MFFLTKRWSIIDARVARLDRDHLSSGWLKGNAKKDSRLTRWSDERAEVDLLIAGEKSKNAQRSGSDDRHGE